MAGMRYGKEALRRWLTVGMALACLLAAGRAPAAEMAATPLEIGVLPYVGVSELIRAYGPLAVHLEKELQRPVRIVTARDYADFINRTAQRAYPLLITASHFGRLAEMDNGYIPLLRPLTTFRILLLAREEGRVKSVADLRDGRIATPGILAQTSTMGRSILAAHGLKVGRDLSFIDAGNHKNAVVAVLKGEADACFVSEGGFRHMRAEDRDGLRIIPTVSSRPPPEAIPVIYAASPDLPAAERDRLRQLISRFANETAEGKAWIDGLKYEGLRPTTSADMRSLDADVAELREILGPPTQAKR